MTATKRKRLGLALIAAVIIALEFVAWVVGGMFLLGFYVLFMSAAITILVILTLKGKS